MTISQIIGQIVPHRNISVRSVYNHISALGIKPLGEVNQRPQQYPEDTPARILQRLGVGTVPVSKKRKAGAR